jgi:uncharacterized membrane protein YbjE (DUF340 family)
MWWFVLTFVLGLAIGRCRLLPTAFLRRPSWFIWPSLALLLVLLGYQVGSEPRIRGHLTEIGWQGLVIAAFAMAGSGLSAYLTFRFFFADDTDDRRPHENETLSSEESEP